ncbi:MAG: HAD family hydrolase, partial [Oscillospiraceae bacterium]|nr:HAD family hydrolase [Oscillospiraceae bacterium]
PVYIVSNIDRADILAAVEYRRFKPSGIFTSEDAKAYKPRKELFELAIKTVGISADEAVHIGDSLNSDVGGAASVGINAVWLNRNNREVPNGIVSVRKLTELFDTMFFK